MGHLVVTASKVVYTGQCKLTSAFFSASNASAGCTIYNGTAAVSANKVLRFVGSSAGGTSHSWSDANGVLMSTGIYCLVSGAITTSIFWD